MVNKFTEIQSKCEFLPKLLSTYTEKQKHKKRERKRKKACAIEFILIQKFCMFKQISIDWEQKSLSNWISLLSTYIWYCGMLCVCVYSNLYWKLQLPSFSSNKNLCIGNEGTQRAAVGVEWRWISIFANSSNMLNIFIFRKKARVRRSKRWKKAILWE